MDMKKTNEAPNPGTEKNRKAARKEKAFSAFFAFLLILTLFTALFYSTYKQFQVERESAYASLHNSMDSLRSLITFEGKLNEAFTTLRDEETLRYCDLTKPFFDYLGVSEETLNACKYHWEATSLYYYGDDGIVLTTENAEPFTLDRSQTRMLKTVGMLFQDGWVYNASRLQDGWVFIKWTEYPNIYNVDFQRIAEAVPSDLCIIENATGNILISTSEETYNFLDESRTTYDEERNENAADGIQAGFLKGDGLLSGVFFEKTRLLNRYSVFVYIPYSTVFNDTLDKTLAVYGLIIIIFLFIWFCSRKIRKKGAALLERKTCRRLGKKHCLNLAVMRRIPPLLLAGILATALFTTYLPLLTNYINHNVQMEKKLDTFIKELELNDEEWEKMETLYTQVIAGRMYMIDMFADYMGENFTREVLIDLALRLDLSSVTIYDAEGVSTMSTDYYVGYKLSENPKDDESNLWTLLRDADTNMMGELSDKSGFYAASRRFFKVPGLIYVTLPDDSLVEMKEQTDINAALLRINPQTYAKMHAYAAEPETFLWATSTSQSTRTIANTLPPTVLMNRYCGTQPINSYTYYLNTMTDEKHVLVSVEQLDVFIAPIKKSMAVIIPEILFCSLLIICGTCIYPYDGTLAEEPEEASGKETPRSARSRLFTRANGLPSEGELQLRMQVRKHCSSLLWLLCTILVVFYFADKLMSPHPMADYLFSRQWQREPSIYSMTTILLSFLFLAVGMRFLKKIMRSLSAKMDSRAETFSDLIISIIQFLLAVAVIVYSLHELGVDTTVILTSAGVISLIIGYGSQSIVSDLVSGVFLIMEDQVRIGEYIEIDGFLGKVENIGLRTTRASYDSRTKIISNANMVDFYNLSREATPAAWSIGLPKEADVDQVRALIEKNEDRFKAELGDRLIRGPIYKGMKKVLWNGSYILLYNSFCNVEDWEDIRADSLEVAYKILRENGIQPIVGDILDL